MGSPSLFFGLSSHLLITDQKLSRQGKVFLSLTHFAQLKPQRKKRGENVGRPRYGADGHVVPRLGFPVGWNKKCKPRDYDQKTGAETHVRRINRGAFPAASWEIGELAKTPPEWFFPTYRRKFVTHFGQINPK